MQPIYRPLAVSFAGRLTEMPHVTTGDTGQEFSVAAGGLRTATYAMRDLTITADTLIRPTAQ